MKPNLPFIVTAAATCVLLVAPAARGTTYYWKGAASGALWFDFSSWSTESATGADATALPTVDDNITTSSALVLRNLAWLREIGVPFAVRVPCIPGVNDAPGDREAFLRLAGPGATVEFLPYNSAAPAKYPLLGRRFPLW